MSNDALRRQAERFLAFALKAREAGNLPLADELTARAMDLFNKADGTADVGLLPASQARRLSTLYGRI